MNADYAAEHQQLRSLLKARVQRSITSAATDGRTVENPSKAAEYVVNALMEWPEGRDVIRRIYRHIEALDIDGSGAAR